jgi:hypothetical protein
LLNTLLEKKSSHQSGNGWKPSVWPDVVKAVQLVNPNAMPAKDQTKVMSKLDDVCFLHVTWPLALQLCVSSKTFSHFTSSSKNSVGQDGMRRKSMQ